MAFEITVGSPHLSINDGWAVLVCAPDGSLSGPATPTASAGATQGC